MGLFYRIRQFWARLRADADDIDWALVNTVLDANGRVLYGDMSLGDQLHSQSVLRLLRSSSDSPLDGTLEQAALLHDVGKAHSGLNLARRTVVVLLRRLWPAGLERLGRPCPLNSWRRPFYVHLHHAKIGAERCRLVGLDTGVIALVRDHEGLTTTQRNPETRELLRLLQRADDQC